MPLDAARLDALLSTARYGRSLRVLRETGSTNDDARADAMFGAPAGHVVLAERQTQGRGSSGRSWSSPGGDDLFLSIVDRLPLALPQLPPLTLAVGLGVAGAVEAVLGGAPAARVKWPNDVWLDGKKCAGILVETSTSGLDVEWVVIGIGLNVNRMSFEPELAGIATSLRAAHPGQDRFDRTAVLAEVLSTVEREVDRFVHAGAAATVRALEPRLAMLGVAARCGDLEGVVAGVSPSGALRMRIGGEIRELHAGRLTPIA